ncbi:PREDICTED: thyroid adenoma-associated protein homolog [Priapulus caudatus]|uniref:tRNA (32-2'-O)-methyltransferase regulator THADA n=1 Tax=Priapulus caudatus TaxID=37621 RepID=A0ABM1EG63_PRICU|nr:PREDICTED: thyroid adenoma-associated protein homolog [Priapulus caudatus]
MGIKKNQPFVNSFLVVGEKTRQAINGLCTVEEKSAGSIWDLLLECLGSSDGLEHVSLIKEVDKKLRCTSEEDCFQTETHADICLQALAEIYCNCGSSRVALRRTLISLIQGLPRSIFERARELLGKHLLCCLTVCSETNKCSHGLDLVVSCTENGNKIGEQCLADNLCDVLQWLSSGLRVFLQNMGSDATPMMQTEAAHSWQVSLKVSIHIVQKLCQASEAPTVQGQESGRSGNTMQPSYVIRTGHISAVIGEMRDTIVTVLNQSCYLLDSHIMCGMALPVFLRVLVTEASFPTLVTDTLQSFYSENSEVGEPSKQNSQHTTTEVSAIGKLFQVYSKVPQLAICNGFIAQLTCDELMHQPLQQQWLLTLLFSHIIRLDSCLTDLIAKTAVSRALVTWTQRAVECTSRLEYHDELSSVLRGGNAISDSLLQYVWTNWESPMDLVRYNAQLVFRGTVQLHLASADEDAEQSVFLLQLARDLLAMPWHIPAKYRPLGCVVEHIGAEATLTLCPGIANELLNCVGELQLAPFVSELLETLFTSHKEQMQMDKEKERWEQAWVVPVFNVICTGTKKQRAATVEHLLCKLLKCYPRSLRVIMDQLAKDDHRNKSNYLAALITCLRASRSMGLLKVDSDATGDASTWNGIIQVSTLRAALCHRDAHLRTDALALLTDSPKTTESFTATDFSLIKCFLTYNLNNQAAAVRQEISAHVKKLLYRMVDSGRCLKRQVRQMKSNDSQRAAKQLEQYRSFLQWLCNLLFASLVPSCSFARRNTALQSLSLVHAIIGFFSGNTLLLPQPTSNEECSGPQPVVGCTAIPTRSYPNQFPLGVLCPSNIQTLLQCISDSYDVNKSLVFNLLVDFSDSLLGFDDEARLRDFLVEALQLAGGNRPSGTVTASYILRLLVCQPRLCDVIYGLHAPAAITKVAGEAKPADCEVHTCCSDVLKEKRFLSLITLLLNRLATHVEVARKSLLHAAISHPIYGIILCIRQVLGDVNFKKLKDLDVWRKLIKDLIEQCFTIAQLVSPVITNDSPEGHLPMDIDDTVSLMQLVTDMQSVHVASPEAQQMNDNPQRDGGPASDTAKTGGVTSSEGPQTMVVTPQMLLICSWRSMKEISLLLGQIVRMLPVVEKHDAPCLLTVQQVKQIGDYFTSQLMESRHRGAFEVAYEGFSQLCNMLWRCPVAGLHSLPDTWLTELLADIQSNSLVSKLCSTRRSAGLPFLMQALVSTEPVATRHLCFKRTMTQLLAMTLPAGYSSTNSSEYWNTTAHVHSLNILRALFRSMQLGEQVLSYADDGLIAALLGGQSNSWSVRNSATMLFSTLITRIFGVKRTKDETSRKNCLTGRVFFTRFPKLYTFLQEKLGECTAGIDSSGRLNLQPALYPLLMVISRLYPSPLQGIDTSLSLAVFIPLVRRCAYSSVLKMREMAARALVPLITVDICQPTFTELLVTLPAQPYVMSQNFVHGTLLQLSFLVRHSAEQRIHLPSGIFSGLQRVFWLATRANACLVTRTTYLEVVRDVLTYDLVADHQAVALHKQELRDATEQLVFVELESHGSCLPNTPMLLSFYTTITDLCWMLGVNQASAASDALGVGGVAMTTQHPGLKNELDIVDRLLGSPFYEVRLHVLRKLRAVVDSGETALGEAGCEVVFEHACVREEPSSTLKATLLHSDTVRNRLVQLARMETNHACIIEVYYLLAVFPVESSFAWLHDGLQLSVTEVMHVVMERGKTAQLDGVRSALLCFTAVLMPLLCAQPPKCELLQEWVDWVCDCSHPEQSITCRMQVARLLVNWTVLLLLDPHHVLGSLSFKLWHCAAILLQDDDVSVKSTAADLIYHLPALSSANHELSQRVQPQKALDMLLDVMILHWSDRDLPGCIHTLLQWLNAEPEQQQDDEDRVFESSDVNMYMEHFTFIDLILNKLETVITLPASSIMSDHSTSSSTESYPTDAVHTSISFASPEGDSVSTSPARASTLCSSHSDASIHVAKTCLRQVSTEDICLVLGKLQELSRLPASSFLPSMHGGGNPRLLPLYKYSRVLLLLMKAGLVEGRNNSQVVECCGKLLTVIAGIRFQCFLSLRVAETLHDILQLTR